MLQGNQESLKILLNEYHNYLVVVGMRYLSDKHRVEDVIHDVFVDLWNSKREVHITSGVKSFLRGAVINKCLAIIRKESRITLVEQHDYSLQNKEAGADQLVDRNRLKAEIDAIIERLPAKCREVFVLSRMEGLSHAEIASKLDISKKTIENHMTKALKTLRSELKRKELLISILILKIIDLCIGVNA